VVVRVRPPLPRELHGLHPYDGATLVDPSGRGLTLSENLRAAANDGVEHGVLYATHRFAFDRVYGPDAPQQRVYDESARGAVASALAGYNASIIAFGQTGAGKTHTMAGAPAGPDRGIIPRAIEDVFAHIQRDTGERCKFLVRASYLQIYNEVISDLLKPAAGGGGGGGAGAGLTVREDKRRGVHVEGLSEWVVRAPADVYTLMERGAAARTTGATRLNELSSRSHAIFILIVEKSTLAADGPAAAAAAAHMAGVEAGGGAAAAAARQSVRVGKLNLVDLAGSERVHLTGATGARLEESKKINQSLSALGNVIAALTAAGGRGARPHVPYRDSKLTRILEDSLGGNCRTTFMAMVSPAAEAFPESLSTLKFAARAKRVRNAPTVNEDLDHRALLRKYERELRRLRAELAQRSLDLVDKRLVLEVDEARRREQADKLAAIAALERQSAEIARHKAAMAALQGRIAAMQSQLLVGGQRVEETPAFRTLLAAEQARIRGTYDARVAELEAERAGMAAGRAAAERLRALLLKQRDVMVALSQRLGERDGEVLELQVGGAGGAGCVRVAAPPCRVGRFPNRICCAAGGLLPDSAPSGFCWLRRPRWRRAATGSAGWRTRWTPRPRSCWRRGGRRPRGARPRIGRARRRGTRGGPYRPALRPWSRAPSRWRRWAAPAATTAAAAALSAPRRPRGTWQPRGWLSARPPPPQQQRRWQWQRRTRRWRGGARGWAASGWRCARSSTRACCHLWRRWGGRWVRRWRGMAPPRRGWARSWRGCAGWWRRRWRRWRRTAAGRRWGERIGACRPRPWSRGVRASRHVMVNVIIWQRTFPTALDLIHRPEPSQARHGRCPRPVGDRSDWARQAVGRREQHGGRPARGCVARDGRPSCGCARRLRRRAPAEERGQAGQRRAERGQAGRCGLCPTARTTAVRQRGEPAEL
jgi:kinesin family protein 3/17